MSMSLYFKNDAGYWSGNEPEELQLNMGNSNAAAVLRAIGFTYEDPWDTTFAIEDLAERVRLFLTSDARDFLDQGLLVTVTQRTGPYLNSPKGATMIDCGRRGGYIEEKCERIARLCEAARAKGATHAYFC